MVAAEDTIEMLTKKLEIYQKLVETLAPSNILTLTQGSSTPAPISSVPTALSTQVSSTPAPISSVPTALSTQVSSTPALISSVPTALSTQGSSTPALISSVPTAPTKVVYKPSERYTKIKEILALMNLKKNEYNNLLVSKKNI
jgi:hypothetical protein